MILVGRDPLLSVGGYTGPGAGPGGLLRLLARPRPPPRLPRPPLLPRPPPRPRPGFLTRLFPAPGGGFVVGVVSGNNNSSGMKLRLSLLLRLLLLTLFCTLGCEGFLKIKL